MGTVALKGEAVLEDDVHTNPVYVSRVPATCSEIAVPLRYREKTIGVLNVESARPARFGADDLRFLVILAAQAAGALKASEFYRTMMRQVEEGRDRIRLLQRVGSLLGATVETEDLLAPRRARRAAGSAPRRRRSTWSARAAGARGRELARVGARAGPPFRRSTPRRSPSPPRSPRTRPPFGRRGPRELHRSGARGHFLGVPLRSSERLLGVLRVLNKLDTSGQPGAEGFTQDDEDAWSPSRARSRWRSPSI